MKKILLLFILLFLGIFLFRNNPSISQVNKVPEISQPIETQPSTQQATTNEIGIPKRLAIPRIGVDAFVESVGLDAKGNMDVPKRDENVAWYNLGFKAGAKGNTVIAGHFDTKTGAPAVFYNIKDLRIGDELVVTSETDQLYTYTVTDIQTYQASQFPLVEVFGSYNKNRLNLITCEGQYSASEGYSHRVVVYSELVD